MGPWLCISKHSYDNRNSDHNINTSAPQSLKRQVAEFIGPLSRWAHDSKTAPRFIKYNMIQTMHLQEDLYDLSVECFQKLAARIDDPGLLLRNLNLATILWVYSE